MADTVTVPGTRAKVPKWAAIGGVAVVGVLIIVYYRNKKNKTSAVTPGTTAAGLATPATGGSDPFPWDGTYNNSNDPYSMDTATGITYGDESAGIGGSGFPFTGGAAGGGGGTGPGGGPPFSTNAAWSQWVIAQLENNPNRNPTDVENAIGEYISGQPVTAPGKNIVFDAIAIGGDPPVAGPGGYPPKIRTAGAATSGGQQGSGGGGSGHKPPRPQVTVPAVAGDSVNDGEKKLQQAGLVPKVTSGGPRNPAFMYIIWSQTPGAGRKVDKGSTVDLAIAAEISGGPIRR